MDLLLDALSLGLWLAFAVEFIRAIEWPDHWRKRKPLSCDVCMVGWCLIAAAHYGWFVQRLDPFSEHYLPAGAIALLVLALLKHWRGLSLLPPE